MWSWLVQQVLGFPRDNGDNVEETAPCQESVQAGGDIRSDNGISYGYSLLRGKRVKMEDFLSAQFERCPKTGEDVGMFGVFDGHGGPEAAMYVKTNLLKNLLKHKEFRTNIDKATEDIYLSTNKTYLDVSKSDRDDGSTAVTAVIVGRKLTIANVGDSRAILCRDGKAKQLSVDHKPNSISEKKRIENFGGIVVWAGTWRVGGVLAVSRAFGDRPLQRYVKADPSVRTEDITAEDEFIILASDGLWDVVSNEEAVSMVRQMFEQQEATPQQAAEFLSETALNRGSNDNISCLVVKFNFS